MLKGMDETRLMQLPTCDFRGLVHSTMSFTHTQMNTYTQFHILSSFTKSALVLNVESATNILSK